MLVFIVHELSSVFFESPWGTLTLVFLSDLDQILRADCVLIFLSWYLILREFFIGFCLFVVVFLTYFWFSSSW